MDGYRISEVAERTGFAPSTLRYYEELGLLPEPRRTTNGYRRYDDDHLDRLQFVARAKRLGLSLDEISDLAAARDDGECSVARSTLADLLDAKLAQVHEDIVEMTRFAQQLEQVYERIVGQPAAHGRCGPDCGCSPELPESPVQGLDVDGHPRVRPA